MMKLALRAALVAAFAFLPSLALAQSSPGLTYGQVPTAGQWNSYFAAKQDVLNYTPVNKAGDTMTGRLVTAAPSATTAGLNLTPGSTPSSPVNGDLWTTTSGLFAQINGSTIGPFITGGSISLTIGTTPIASGTTTRVLYDNAGVLGEYAISGSGSVAMTTSPTFVTPTLGAATATSINGNTLTAGTWTLTGGSGKTLTFSNTLSFTGTDGTSFAFPATSGSVLTADSTNTLTNKTFDTAGTGNSFSINGLAATANTGTGSVVRATSPTLVTPALGAATATSINGLTITSSTGVLTIANGKTLTASNSLTFTGTDATSFAFPTGSGTVVTADSTATLSNKTISGSSNTLSNIALSSLASQAANTLNGNVTSGAASPTAFTIGSLTLKASPDSGDDVIIGDNAASGAVKRTSVGALIAGGAVGSINGQGGALTFQAGVTNTTSTFYLDGNYLGYGAPSNCTLDYSASASALTVALKTAGGSDPSSASPCYLNFRNGNGNDGNTLRTITAATSVTIPSGATMGVTSSTAFNIWTVAVDDGGTIRLGAINASTANIIYGLDEGVLVTTTLADTSADNAGVIYTGTAVSTPSPFRIVGYGNWTASGLTAGTWTTTNLDYVQAYGPGVAKPGDRVGYGYTSHTTQTTSSSTTYTATASTISYVIKSAANKVRVAAAGDLYGVGAGAYCVAQIRRGTSTTVGWYAGLYVAIETPWSAKAFDFPNAAGSRDYTVYMVANGTQNCQFNTQSGAPFQFSAGIEVEEIKG